ncbi:hypothetical protein GOBAR_AA03084 [Gossypium barbadense]|uniref:Uncharacterized protein n=1 Tax=Gossypium barbadense TaxID=3634 RepID=A0A2P5YPF4_GOSBA|nr:hypothetical protein GOBAR_AA03084 [Gossypium barbadense]
MSSSRGKKVVVPASKKMKGASSFSSPTAKVRYPFLRFPIGPQEKLSQILRAQPLIAGHCIDWAAVHRANIQRYHDGTMLNVPSSDQEFKEENDLDTLNCHIHRSPSWCWHALIPGGAAYNPNHSKASSLPPSLRLLSTAAQESSLTLVGQMSPQDISSMLSMRMTEKRQGTYPPQYRLAQSTEEESFEDIPDDVPLQHENPPSQPPPLSRPVHAAASYTNISEHLTRFEQQCFQRFDNIDATLQQFVSTSTSHINSSKALRDLKPHWEQFSTTSMSCSPTIIATTRYNILLAQDLWTNEPLPPPEYLPPPSRRLFSETPVQGNSFITQEVSLLSLSYFYVFISIFVY